MSRNIFELFPNWNCATRFDCLYPRFPVNSHNCFATWEAIRQNVDEGKQNKKKKAKEKKTLWKLAKITGLRLTLESRFSLHWQTIDTICLVFPRFSSLLSRLFLSLPVPDPCRDNDNDNKESHSRWRFSFGFASLANNPFYLIIYSVAFASAADWRDGIKIT